MVPIQGTRGGAQCRRSPSRWRTIEQTKIQRREAANWTTQTMTPTEKSAVRKSCDLESMRFRALAEKMSKIVMRWAVMKEHQEIASIIGELLEWHDDSVDERVLVLP